jgi:hypothetical protein
MISRSMILLVVIFAAAACDPPNHDDRELGEAGDGTTNHGGTGGGGAGGGGAGGSECTIPEIHSLDPDRGRVGTPVFVRGACLDGEEIDVFFAGGTRSAVAEASGDGTWLRTAVPLGAATGTIRLVVDGVFVDGPIFTVVDENPPPVLNSVSPDLITVGARDTLVTLTGSGFIESSVVYLDDAEIETTGGSATSLQVRLEEELLAVQARHSFRVENPSPGGGVSETVPLLVSGPFNLVSAVATGPTSVRLEFDIAPDPEQAVDTSHYTIPVVDSPTHEKLGVSRAVVSQTDARIVMLTTAPQEPGVAYRVICYDLTSVFDGRLMTKSQPFSGFTP